MRCFVLSLTISLALAVSPVLAQPDTSAKTRPLAPGVLTVIAPEHEDAETHTQPRPLPELQAALAARPELSIPPQTSPESSTLVERAKLVTVRRTIWNLEFAFKPMRRLQVDIPDISGRMQRKNIWYMVYRLRNIGNNLTPNNKPLDIGRDIQPTDDFKPLFSETARATKDGLRFIPSFVFYGHVLENKKYLRKEYLDRIIPAAAQAIQNRETMGKKLYNTVEISQFPIPASTAEVDNSIWGVVTWEDVDPRIDYFSIFIQGLTNAYQYEDPAGAYKAPAPPGSGRRFYYKTLKLNFWRAGDSLHEHEEEIRFGVRKDPDAAKQTEILKHYGLNAPLDYVWVYR